MYSEIDVNELRAWRDGGKDFVLLDVRDDDEIQTASIDGSVHIPMAEIPARFMELDKQNDIAVLCHHGGRSMRVAAFLAMQGFPKVYNVDGGIDAYARQIDTTIARY
jgi:rhodanese-related sulfurtransferase